MQDKTATEVYLRAITGADLERIRAWVNDPEIEILVDRVRPVSDFEHAAWFRQIAQDPTTYLFAVCEKETGSHIGNAWLYNADSRHRKAELRIFIGDKKSWGKGCGPQAIKMLVDFGFKKLNLNKIYAYVLATNPRAKAAFEKAGFFVEGEFPREYFVDGLYVDGYRLAILSRREQGGCEAP